MPPKSKNTKKSARSEQTKKKKQEKYGLFLEMDAGYKKHKQLLLDKFEGCVGMKCVVSSAPNYKPEDTIVIPDTTVDTTVATDQIITDVFFDGENGLEGVSNIGIVIQRQGNRIIVEVRHSQSRKSKMQVFTVATPTFVEDEDGNEDVPIKQTLLCSHPNCSPRLARFCNEAIDVEKLKRVSAEEQPEVKRKT